MKPFTVKLSQTQYSICRPILRECSTLGDCNLLLGLKAEFPDYEGVQHFLVRLRDVPTPTLSNMRSIRAVKSKIDSGVRKSL